MVVFVTFHFQLCIQYFEPVISRNDDAIEKVYWLEVSRVDIFNKILKISKKKTRAALRHELSGPEPG